MSRNQFEDNEQEQEVEIKVDGVVVGHGVYNPRTGVVNGDISGPFTIVPGSDAVTLTPKAQDPADRYRVKE